MIPKYAFSTTESKQRSKWLYYLQIGFVATMVITTIAIAVYILLIR